MDNPSVNPPPLFVGHGCIWLYTMAVYYHLHLRIVWTVRLGGNTAERGQEEAVQTKCRTGPAESC